MSNSNIVEPIITIADISSPKLIDWRLAMTNMATCSRCGRSSHDISTCYALTHENGKKLPPKKGWDKMDPQKCSRCGRESHTVRTCNANTHENGKPLPESTKAKNR